MSNRNRWKKWTEEEDEYVKNNKDKTVKQLADALNRTQRAVIRRREMLGLTTVKRRWTEKEELYILENHEMKTVYELALDLDRTYPSVRKKLTILKNKGVKDKEEAKRFEEFEKQARNYIDGDDMAIDPFELEHFLEVFKIHLRGLKR